MTQSGVHFRWPTLLRRSAWVVASITLAHLLFGWFAFEPLARWAAPRFVEQKTGGRLAMEAVRFDPLRLALEMRGLALTDAGGKPLLAMKRLFVDFEAASLFKRAWLFDEVRLTGPVLDVELRSDGRVNWLDFIDAFADPNAAPVAADAAPPRLQVRRLVLEEGRIALSDQQIAGGFSTQMAPLQIEVDNLSTLPEDRGDHSVTATTEIGATVRWKGTVGLNPVTATGDLAIDGLALERLWPYLKNRLDMQPPRGTAGLSLAYRASYAARRLDLALEKVEARLDQLQLQGTKDAAPSVALSSVRLQGGRFDLARREASVKAVSIDGGRVAIELDAAGRPQVLGWLKTGSEPPAQPPGSPVEPAASGAPPWRVGVEQVAVDGVALGLIDRGFVAPLEAEVGALRLRLAARAEIGDGPPAADLEGVEVQLANLSIASGDKPRQRGLLRGASVDVTDTRVSLAKQEVVLGKVAFGGGQVEVVRDAQGRLSVAEALQRVPSAAPPRAEAPSQKAAKAQPSPWRYRVGALEARDFQVAFLEASVSPPLDLSIEGLNVKAEGLSDQLDADVPVSAQFRIRQGGRFEAQGRVSPGAPSADLNIRLSDLALTPAQPLLAKTTNLVLANGRLDTQGRMRYRGGKASYDGSFALRQLQLNEASTGDGILGWNALSTQRLQATQGGLRIGELALNGLNSKLVIFQDRSVNIARLLKPDAEPAAAPAAPEANATTKAAAYRIDIDSVRLTEGEMDFADLSLALPFGTRIHGLKGSMVGLSSQPGAAAQVEFDGSVDPYGLARAAGRINLFDPTAFTDLKVVFRNVEMTTLTPYSATFAGRRIESGKLSLDLEYKIQQRQLAGENQIVMEQLTLGERVASATAMNLPLDLAIAILSDADGKIDLGLPVSGSLDDPSFSYGQIVWKAFVNVITKVATAPFRALGAMLGVNGDKLDAITFDRGSATLLPPEKEKLANLAKLLGQRPGLALSVRADFDPAADREALKQLRLRRAIAQESGRTLAADEDPGPVSTTQASTRQALERLHEKRSGASASQPAAASAAAADPHALMLQRLLEATLVEDAELRALAGVRNQAISSALLALGVNAARVQLQEPRAGAGASGGVHASLELAALKGSTAASAPSR